MKIFFRLLQKIPSLVWLGLVVFGIGSVWLHDREKAAVARADLHRFQDSVRVADSITTVTINRTLTAWQDTIAQLQARKTRVLVVAAKADTAARVASVELHAIVDTSAILKPIVDRLETEHAREVFNLKQAIALGAELHVMDSLTIRRLEGLMGDYQRSNATLMGRLTAADKAAHPGVVKQIIRAAPYIVVAAGVGYYSGQKKRG